MQTLLTFQEFVFMPSISSFCLFVGIRVDYGPKFRDFVPNSVFLLKTHQICPKIQDHFNNFASFLSINFMENMGNQDKIRMQSWFCPVFVLIFQFFPDFTIFLRFIQIFFPDFLFSLIFFSDFPPKFVLNLSQILSEFFPTNNPGWN